MPYILDDQREELDAIIDGLDYQLKHSNSVPDNNDTLCGRFNYCVFRLIKRLTDPYCGGQQKYARFNALIGALECCKQEIYRKLIVPYEDKKIEENGNVI